MSVLRDSLDFIYIVEPFTVKSRTYEKLSEFKKLRKGWNYGKGRPILDGVYECAVDLLNCLRQLGLSKTDAFPGADGDVCITAYRFSHYLEITIETDVSISISHEVEDNEVFSEGALSLESAKYCLRKVVEEIWSSSGLSTHGTTMERKTDSIAWLSRIHQTEVEYLSLVGDVSDEPEVTSVVIFENSTPRFLANLQYFGSSENRFYQTATG